MARRPLGDDMGLLAFVHAAALFRHLDEGVRHHLCRDAVVVDLQPTDVAVPAGSPSLGLFMVVEGALMFDGGLLRFERGAICGEHEVLTARPYAHDLVSDGDTVVVHFPVEAVRRAVEAEPKLGRKLAALMAAREKEVERRTREAGL